MKRPPLPSLQFLHVFGLLTLLGLSAPLDSRASVLLAGWYASDTSTTTYPQAAAATYSVLVSSASLVPVSLTANEDGRNVWGHANASSELDTATAPHVSYQVEFVSGRSVQLQKFFLGGYAQLDPNTIAVVRSSLDGFATNLKTLSNTSDYTNNVADLSGFSPVSGTVEFRIYFYNASTLFAENPTWGNMYLASGSGYPGDPYDSLQGFHNVGLIGVEAIPEPDTWAMLAAGLGALVLLRRAQH